MRSRRWFKVLWALLPLMAMGSLAVPVLLSRYRQQTPHALAQCLLEYYETHEEYPESWEHAVSDSFLTDYLRAALQDPDPRLDFYYTAWSDRTQCEFVLIDRPLPFWKKQRTRHAYWESLEPEVFHEQLWR